MLLKLVNVKKFLVCATASNFFYDPFKLNENFYSISTCKILYEIFPTKLNFFFKVKKKNILKVLKFTPKF